MLGLLLAAAVAGAHPSEASPYFLDDSTVVQVMCSEWTGSAFYIGNGEYVTARHVIRDDKKRFVACSVHDKPIRVTAVGAIHDYATFKAAYYPPFRAIVSCEGIKEGRNYYAQGYAKGRPWVVTQRLIGTSDYYRDRDDHQASNGAQARGSTTEGQSGGPVSNDDGLVVGIVSAGDTTGETNQIFVSLSDTPICKVRS